MPIKRDSWLARVDRVNVLNLSLARTCQKYLDFIPTYRRNWGQIDGGMKSERIEGKIQLLAIDKNGAIGLFIVTLSRITRMMVAVIGMLVVVM